MLASSNVIDKTHIDESTQVKPFGMPQTGYSVPTRFAAGTHLERAARVEVVELFRAVDRFCIELEPNKVKRSYRAKTVNYRHEKGIFCSIHLCTSGLRVWLKLKYAELSSPPEYVRDVSHIGHWGVGDVELRIDSLQKFQDSKSLI